MSPGDSPRRRAARWLLAAILAAAVLLLAAALLRPPAGASDPAAGRAPVTAATAPGDSAPPPGASAPLPGASAGPAARPSVTTAGSPALSAPPASSRARRPIPEAELQRVVVAGARALKQECWEKAQASGTSAATSARVALAFTVGPAGTLTRARATGGEAFAALDACVEAVARRWTFPAGYDETGSQAEFRFRTE